MTVVTVKCPRCGHNKAGVLGFRHAKYVHVQCKNCGRRWYYNTDDTKKRPI